MALDYSILFQGPTAGQQIRQGIGDFMQIRAADAAAKQQELKQQQAAAAAEQQAAFNQAFGQAFQSKDPQALKQLVGQFPGQFKQIQEAIGIRDDMQGKALGSLGVQLSQLATSDPQAAAQLIAQNEGVLRQAGPAYAPESLLSQLQQDPQGLAERADNFALVALGPKTFYDVQGARQKVQAQIRGQDITMRGQDIQQAEGAANRAQDMSLKQLTLQENALDRELRRLESAAKSETNDLKRQELQLKIQDRQQKLASTKQESQATKNNALSNLQEAQSIAQEIAADPRLSSITGQIASRIPTLRGESQDLINKANRLQSLLTVDNLKLMTGVLTDRDIQFLTNVASGLNITEDGIKGSVGGVQKRLTEISDKISGKLVEEAPAQSPGGIKFLGFE